MKADDAESGSDGSLYPQDPLLLIDDEEAMVVAMQLLLRAAGFRNTVPCTNPRQVHSLLGERSFSAVVLDLGMPGISGMDLLPSILQQYPGMPVLVVTGQDDVNSAVQCMKAGAFDYVVKPPDATRLIASLRHAIEQREIRNENQRLRDSFFSRSLANPGAFAGIVTRSVAMHTIFRYVEAIAPTSLPILITGETGSGKELVARSIHAASGRTGKFVAVNAAGLDDALFSDTLFGHHKGAFTDASGAREGMIARAAGGTLFLDEVGDLPVESQVRILRLLQEKEYYPLGSDAACAVEARFVFATNRDLDTQAAEGGFRQDLYYRLQSHRIRLPSLRERRDDIPLLVDHFMQKTSNEIGRAPPRPPRELYTLLQTYRFPGNIRELEGMIADAVVRNDSKVLPLDHLKEQLGAKMGGADSHQPGSREPMEGNPFASLESLPPLSLASSLLIDEAMRRAEGNQTIAAHLLGMSRTTLNKRLHNKS